MKKTILYARTSSDDRERDSLSHQEKDCRECAPSRGYEIVKVFAEDVKGISGQFINSPALAEALEFCEREHVEVFLIRDIERFTREGLKGELVLSQLDNLGVTLDSAWEPWIKEPTARMMLKMMFNLAEQNKDSIVRKLKNGRWHLVKEGKPLCHGHAPLGYDYTKDEKVVTLTVNQEEAKIVRLIFDLYLEGGSLQGVARELTNRGIPTYTRLREDENVFGRDPKVDGGKWAASTVKSILTNTTYYGEFKYGRFSSRFERHIDLKAGRIDEKLVKFKGEDPFLVTVPAIVSRDTFDEVQALIHRNRAKKGRHPKGEFLMAKRLTCPCGKAVLCESRYDKRRGKQYLYYRFSHNECSCGKQYLPASLIDDEVWDWVCKVLWTDSWEDHLLEQYNEQQESQEALKQQLAKAERAKRETRREYDGLIKVISLSDDYGSSLLLENKSKLEERLRKHDAAIAELKKALEPKKGLRMPWDLIAYVKEHTPGFVEPFERKREFVERLNVKALVQREGDEIKLEVRCRVSEKALTVLLHKQPSAAAPTAGRTPATTP